MEANTAEYRLPSHFLNDISEAVGAFGEVGVVDLAWVTEQNNFCAFSGTGNDALDFVFGEVLSLVNDHEGVFE